QSPAPAQRKLLVVRLEKAIRSGRCEQVDNDFNAQVHAHGAGGVALKCEFAGNVETRTGRNEVKRFPRAPVSLMSGFERDGFVIKQVCAIAPGGQSRIFVKTDRSIVFMCFLRREK